MTFTNTHSPRKVAKKKKIKRKLFAHRHTNTTTNLWRSCGADRSSSNSSISLNNNKQQQQRAKRAPGKSFGSDFAFWFRLALRAESWFFFSQMQNCHKLAKSCSLTLTRMCVGEWELMFVPVYACECLGNAQSLSQRLESESEWELNVNIRRQELPVELLEYIMLCVYASVSEFILYFWQAKE